ncbi:MAG: hypothetical protein JXR76_08065 [Deltaproteobacteria bacterium]|nr:hypothetical protein [Deltaproteobacteria bacterium]
MNRILIIAVAILAGFGLLSASVFMTRSKYGTTTETGDVTVVNREGVASSSNSNSNMSQNLQIARLQAEINSLKRQLANTHSQTPADKNEIDVSLENKTPEEVAEIVKSQDIQQAAVLEQQLSVGPKDQAWETQVRDEAAVVFKKFEGKATLTKVNCSDRFCRADINMDQLEARGDVLRELQYTPPFATNGFIYVKSSDDPQTMLYFTRDAETGIQQVAPLDQEMN